MPSLTALVNQRLACARMLHSDLAHARTPGHNKALLDACLFHLSCGYRFYVRELATYYGVQNAAILNDERAAARALEQMGKTPAEIRELCHLREQPHSWLSQLQGLYRACWELATPEQPRAPAGIETIALHDLDKNELPELDTELIGEFCRRFQELVERHRQTSVEC